MFGRLPPGGGFPQEREKGLVVSAPPWTESHFRGDCEMKKLDENVSRRDFGKLAVAAFGGVVAGSMLGSSLLSADDKKPAAAAKADAHACCGLNACKGQGK